MSRNSTQPRSWAEMVEAGERPSRRHTDPLTSLVDAAHGGDADTARLSTEQAIARLDRGSQPEPTDDEWDEWRHAMLPDLARQADRRDGRDRTAPDTTPTATTSTNDGGGNDRGRLVHGERDRVGNLSALVYERADGSRHRVRLSEPIETGETSGSSDEPGPVVGHRVDARGRLIEQRRQPGDVCGALPMVEKVVGKAPPRTAGRRHRASGRRVRINAGGTR